MKQQIVILDLMAMTRDFFIKVLPAFCLLFLLIMTSGLFITDANLNPYFDFLFARTTGGLFNMEHFSSVLAVMGVGWFIILADRLKGIAFNMMTWASLYTLHELPYNFFYSHPPQVMGLVSDGAVFDFLAGWGFITAILVWGKSWQRKSILALAVYFSVYFFIVGGLLNIPVTLAAGLSASHPLVLAVPYATQIVPNLAEVTAWVPAAFILICFRLRFKQP